MAPSKIKKYWHMGGFIPSAEFGIKFGQAKSVFTNYAIQMAEAKKKADEFDAAMAKIVAAEINMTAGGYLLPPETKAEFLKLVALSKSNRADEPMTEVREE